MASCSLVALLLRVDETELYLMVLPSIPSLQASQLIWMGALIQRQVCELCCEVSTGLLVHGFGCEYDMSWWPTENLYAPGVCEAKSYEFSVCLCMKSQQCLFLSLHLCVSGRLGSHHSLIVKTFLSCMDSPARATNQYR